MPTTTVKSIGSASRDYSTIAAWEADAPANLVTSDEIWKGECYNDSEFTITAAIEISGSTSDATRYKWLTTASGQGFRDHADKATNPLRYDQAKGVGVKTTTAYIRMMYQSEFKFVLENIQFRSDTSTNTEVLTRFDGTSGTGVSTIKACLFDVTEAGRLSTCWQGIINFINCLFIMRQSGGGDGIDWKYHSSGSGMYNCTVVRPSDRTAAGNGTGGNSLSSVTLKNCAFFGWSTNYSGTYNSNSNYNASSSTDAPGANSQQSLTFADQFETSGNTSSDFRAKSTGSLDANGTVDSGNTGDLDIVGQTRSASTPTIGAWEVVSGGGGGRTTKNTRGWPLGMEIGMNWRGAI